MKNYRVEVGRPDGKSGDTISVTAASPAEASAIAGGEAVKTNPEWIVLAIYEEVV